MALPSTPTTSLLPCSVSSERPRHLKFLSASHWLAQSGLSSGSAPPPPGGSAPLHLPTPHLCWLSNLHDCLEMLTVGWRPAPAPRTAGPVPVLQELPHTCPTQQHTGPMAPRTLFAVCLGCQCGRCLGKGTQSGGAGSLSWKVLLVSSGC